MIERKKYLDIYIYIKKGHILRYSYATISNAGRVGKLCNTEYLYSSSMSSTLTHFRLRGLTQSLDRSSAKQKADANANSLKL